MLSAIIYRGEDIKNPTKATIGTVYLAEGVCVRKILGFDGYGKEDPAIMPRSLMEIDIPEGFDMKVGDIL